MQLIARARTFIPLVAALFLLLAGCTTSPPYIAAPPPQARAPHYPHTSIHDAVHAALAASPDLRGTRISVRTEPGGIVYLDGYVYSRAQRRIAHNVAHSVRGVRRVLYNQLYVR